MTKYLLLLVPTIACASGPKYTREEMFLLKPCKSVVNLHHVAVIKSQKPITPFNSINNSPEMNPRSTDIAFPLFSLSDGHTILKKRIPLKLNPPLSKK